MTTLASACASQTNLILVLVARSNTSQRPGSKQSRLFGLAVAERGGESPT